MLQPCPCGTGRLYAACCGRLHRRTDVAATAEELMRSRYAAYALGEEDHLFRTWHPRTRPDVVRLDPSITWTGLEVVDTGDDTGDDTVEFVATYVRDGRPGRLHEVSRFEQRRGEWVYVDGDVNG